MAHLSTYLEINQGRVSGNEPVVVFGRNSNIGSQSAPEDIISQGGEYQGFLATGAEILDIVSDSTDDAPGQIGSQDVLIFGLDENYDEISERVVLNGTNIVKTLKTYLRVNHFMADNVRSNERNSGVITAVQTTATHIMSSISVGAGIAHQAIYTVPNKKHAIPQHLSVILNGVAAGRGENTIEAREGPGKTWRQFFIAALSQGGGGQNLDILITRVLTSKSDLRVRALGVSDNNSSMSARFTIILVDVSVVNLPAIPA